MAEITPQIKLTKVELHQAGRSNGGLSQKDLLALSWRIGTQPSLYRELIPNPYTHDSQLALSATFPDVSFQDGVKATILAEPEEEYDRRFKQLPHKQQKEALYQQVDKSAATTIRLAKFLEKHHNDFWDMSEDMIYPLLTEVAFGTADLSGIEKNFAQNQRRGFRLSIVNFIEDLQKLKFHKKEFELDAKVTAAKIFGWEIEGDMEIESLPVGFILYLDGQDYQKFYIDEKLRGGESAGFTIANWMKPCFPQELEGKVIVVNKDLRDKSKRGIKETRKHELRHVLFAGFAAEKAPVETLDTEKIVSQLTTLQDHRQYAETLKIHFAEYARNEIISYLGSADTIYKSLSDLGSNKWFDHLEKIRNHLWIREDLAPEQKVLIYKEYTDKFVNYLWQIREYQWIERNLFNRITSSSLSIEKAEALLQNTPFDKARRLCRYFDVEANDVSKKIQQEQGQQVREFSEKVNKFVEFGVRGMLESDLNIMWERMDQITKITYPKNAIPALLKLVENSDISVDLARCIDGIEIISYMQQDDFSAEEFDTIKLSLQNMINKRTGDDFKYVRTKAQSLIQTVDKIRMYGGEDFIHNPPLIAKVSKLMKTPEGQLPTEAQVLELTRILADQDSGVWREYFKKEYVDLLKENTELIPDLADIGNRVESSYGIFMVCLMGLIGITN